MAQVILLTDITDNKESIHFSRYIAPYILATNIRKMGYSCVVLDYFTKFDNLFEILKKLIDEKTIFIGMAGTFLSLQEYDESDLILNNLPYSAGYLWLNSKAEFESWIEKIRNIVKDNNSKALLALGGTKALFFLQSSEKRNLFDFYVIGKAEQFIDQLIHLLDTDAKIPWSYYEGARFLHGGNFNKPDTDSITKVVWSKSDFIQKGESLPLEIAKGCLYNCKFCNFEKQSSLKKALSDLKDELIFNYENFGTSVYHFCDDCFNDTRLKVEEYCNLFLSLPFKIEWVSYARVDIAVKFPHTLDLMVKSGARGLFWGIETLNHKVSKSIGKGTDPDKVKEMLLTLKNKFGSQVISMGSFIIGLPGESEDSINSTFDWVASSRVFDILNINPLFIRPYSERLDKAVIDYADYSRNPTKYGFSEVSFDPLYWKHELMDMEQAQQIRAKYRAFFESNGYDFSVMSTVFQYPHLRSIGYSHLEIMNIIKSARWGNSLHKEIQFKQKNWIDTNNKFIVESILKPESAV